MSIDRLKEIGTRMAECIRASSQQMGFTRRIMFYASLHTVPEFSVAEYAALQRLDNKFRKGRWWAKGPTDETRRQYVRYLRSQPA